MGKLYKRNEEISINITKKPTVESDNTNNVVKEEKNTSNENVNKDSVFDKIKEIFTNENNDKPNSSDKKIFFTSSKKKSKHSFTIENTAFSPQLALVLHPKTFSERYLKQLEDYIYTSKETMDIEKIYSIVYLFSFINRGLYPICVKTNRFKILLNQIVSTLNKFVNENYSVIKSIYIMFNSLKDTLEEEKDAKKKESG